MNLVARCVASATLRTQPCRASVKAGCAPIGTPGVPASAGDCNSVNQRPAIPQGVAVLAGKPRAGKLILHGVGGAGVVGGLWSF